MRCFLRISMVALALFVTAPAMALSKAEELHIQMLANPGIYDDPELAEYIGRLISQVVSVSEMAGDHFTFTLLDSPDVNAFVTDGNFVYVNRGLLNYVQNEAQLVSILGHEIAHVTQNHVSSMPIKAGGAKFVTWLAAALSGSNEVYQAGMAYANSLLKGHGRDNELEADEAGARYMVSLGYDPEEMLDMLTTMKDLEVLQKDRAAQSGAPRGTYHGIFSSHPRSDMRLRSAVAKAERIEKGEPRGDGADRYRIATNNLVWGENFKEKETEPERFVDMGKRIRFDFPEGWQHGLEDDGKTVSGEPEGGGSRLSMEPKPRTPQEPEEYLYNYLNIPPLQDGQEIAPARLKGYTGILPGSDGGPDQRIAVIFYKMNAFLFTGEVSDQQIFSERDQQFLKSISTFRPVSSREMEGKKPTVMRWVKATSATTFDALAAELNLNPYELQDLRLINGYYPDGEPEAGEWIKIFIREFEPDEVTSVEAPSG
ncbi:MAG TPA: M48 family metalloprotease [Xanthomonadales bacterium]|nr:M48 family metalloprotease [Xanthomonadales bacterium]